MTEIIKVNATCNKNKLEFTCPLGCHTKYNKDGTPSANSKRKTHTHNKCEGEVTIQRSPHCDAHIRNQNYNGDYEFSIEYF